ncbi:MAG: Zn-dependent protease [Planctomycetota bacterium]
MDPKVVETALVIGFLILSLGIHEAAHAWVALLCGDPTARDLGRLTLNPIAHIDPFFTILMPAMLYWTTGMAFGGAKPVPVFAPRMRKPLRDMMFVALAGPISNLILAWIFLMIWKVLLLKFEMGQDELAPRVMFASARFNLILAIFNMIPIPPLDGSRVMAFFLPSPVRESYVALERFGMIIVIVLFMSGALHGILGVTLNPLLSFYHLSLTGGNSW